MINKRSWISLHIFYNGDLNKLLWKLLIPFVEQLYTSHLINHYFFIRYWEGGTHIRLRILPTGNLSPEWIENGLINALETNRALQEEVRIVLTEYVPEFKRYGGSHSINLAEECFEYSSNAIMKILKQHEKDWNYSNAISFAMQMHLLFLKNSGMNDSEIQQFLDFLIQANISFAVKEGRNIDLEEKMKSILTYFENSYNQQKESIDYMCNVLWMQETNTFDGWRESWSKNIQSLITKYNNLDLKGGIEAPQWIGIITDLPVPSDQLRKWTIWNSYFHMSNNRIGLHLRDEPFIYFVLKKGLFAIFNSI